MSSLPRSCLLGAGLVLTAAASAAGADLPASPAPAYKAPAAAPTYDWTGFYVGGHGNYTWSDSSGTLSNTASGAVLSSGGHSSSAWHGGGQIGYDYMLPSHVVVGIIADVSSGTSNTTGNGSVVNAATTQEDNVASGTVRGRLGYAIDNVLLYGTAGWNWVDANTTRTRSPATSAMPSPAPSKPRTQAAMDGPSAGHRIRAEAKLERVHRISLYGYSVEHHHVSARAAFHHLIG